MPDLSTVVNMFFGADNNKVLYALIILVTLDYITGHAAVPEGLTKRCLKTINAHFSNMRRSSSLRIVKKAINLAAVLIAISTLLFTSAFAISDEFRTATLNLVITANEKAKY